MKADHRPETPPGLKGLPERIGLSAKEAAGTYFAHHCFNLAAAVAFYAILSLIPFFFIIVSVAGRIIGSSEAVHQAIAEYVAKVLPFHYQVLLSEAEKINLGSGFYGWLGILFMVYCSSLVFDSLEYAFNRVFEVQRKRSFLRTKLLSFSLILGGSFFLVFAFLLATGMGALASLSLYAHLPGSSELQHLLLGSFGRWLPYLLLFGVVVMAFRIVPALTISYPLAFLGAGCSVFGWSVEKWVFGWIILPNPAYGLIYGSLKAMIILILWIYISMCIILYSAEIVAAYRRLFILEEPDGPVQPQV